MQIGVEQKLVDPSLDLEAAHVELRLIGTQDWASTESSLHRLLASRILAAHGRTANTRSGHNVDRSTRLRLGLGMI